MGQDAFVWWIGIVEDNNDPLLTGRARVRIFGYHPKSTLTDATYNMNANNQLATDKLPWAIPILPLNFHGLYGKVEVGEWVFGFFLDGEQAQEPVMMGYFPAAYKQEKKFSKTETPRSFQDLGGFIPDGPYKGIDFSSKSNRLEWHSPSNHLIRITEEATPTSNKDFVLAHSTGNLFVAMQTTSTGQSVLTLSHPSGTALQLTETDIVVNSPRWGTYNLINQLDWISQVQHTTGGGGKRGPRSFTIRTRDYVPPPPPPPSGGGGGGCFIGSSLISMPNDKRKRIDKVQIGDYVLSKDRTRLNRVRFVEIVDAKKFKEIYTPSKRIEPFATLDHPLYIHNELTAVSPKLTEGMYPWLGEMKEMRQSIIKENAEEFVYNLWVDGDGTYIVNDYGTTSIIFDGGMLCDQLESNQLTVDDVQSLYAEYTNRGPLLLHGAYVLNYFIGKWKCKPLNYIISRMAKKTYYHPIRWPVTLSMYAISCICHATSFLHKWRFRK